MACTLKVRYFSLLPFLLSLHFYFKAHVPTVFILKSEKYHQYFEGVLPYYSAYLATTKITTDIAGKDEIIGTSFCLRRIEFNQTSRAAVKYLGSIKIAQPRSRLHNTEFPDW